MSILQENSGLNQAAVHMHEILWNLYVKKKVMVKTTYH